MLHITTGKNGEQYIIASELHQQLKVKTRFIDWIKRMMTYGFEENMDYLKKLKNEFNSQQTQNQSNIKKLKNDRLSKRGRKAIEYYLTIDTAKEIAMIQRTPEGKAIRTYLLQLNTQVEDGKLLSTEETTALIEIAKVVGYFTVNKKLEQDHHQLYGQAKNWWTYRAKLLGYSKASLMEKAKALGIRYKSQRQILIKTAPLEIVKTGIIDLLKLLGKSDTYAQNAALHALNIVKATDMPLDIRNDKGDTLDFKSLQQKKVIARISTAYHPKQLGQGGVLKTLFD